MNWLKIHEKGSKRAAVGILILAAAAFLAVTVVLLRKRKAIEAEIAE